MEKNKSGKKNTNGLIGHSSEVPKVYIGLFVSVLLKVFPKGLESIGLLF